MKVKELIKELQEYDGDIEIEVINSCGSREKLDDVLCERNVKKQKDTVILFTDNIKIDEKYTEEEQELIDLDYGTGYTKKFVK